MLIVSPSWFHLNGSRRVVVQSSLGGSGPHRGLSRHARSPGTDAARRPSCHRSLSVCPEKTLLGEQRRRGAPLRPLKRSFARNYQVVNNQTRRSVARTDTTLVIRKCRA